MQSTTRQALNIDGNESGTLDFVSAELAAAGENGARVLIQETYYNDAQANASLRASAKAHGLMLESIFQWPIARGATTAHFSMD